MFLPRIRVYASIAFAVIIKSGCASYSPEDNDFSEPLTNPEIEQIQVDADIEAFVAFAHAHHPLVKAAIANIESANAALTSAGASSEYLYVLENLELQKDLIQLLNQFAAVAEQSYAVDSVSLSDLLRAQNAVDSVRSEKMNLEQLVVSRRARLNAALGRYARESLSFDYSLLDSHWNFAHHPVDIETLYSLAEEHSPQLAVSRYEIQSQTVATDVANTAGLPKLMVGVEYTNEAMRSGTFAGMASVSLPIWRSNFRAEHNRELYGQVLLTRAERAVATSLSNYQNGNARYTDVISSQQEWLSFALAYRRALANQLSAVAAIKSLITSGANSEVSNEKY